VFNFVHPFTLGLWLVAIPVLIHLINMFRHRPVQWAAMEFLLASQKKFRTWVILKQLLLLLLRMAAIALVVLALAQPLLPERLGGFLGGRPTHHIVILDDSYSMSDRRGEKSAFDLAKDAITRLGDSMLRPREPQSLTLLRLSRCGHYGGGLRPDFQKERVDSGFAERLGAVLKDIQSSQTAAEPLPALEPEIIQQLLGADTGEHRVVYLISDFRARQWDKPDDLKKRLMQVDAAHAEIRLVDCVEDSGHANLAITALEPEEGIRAAGLRWRMKITVQNYGPATARKVPFVWTAERNAVQEFIDEIPPGGSADKLFYVSFDTAGQHQIAAHLEADAVAADNNRFAVVDLPLETPVLLVDGATNGKPTNSRRLQDVMSPGGTQPTGIDARRIESPRYLALPTRPLADFAMISVANVDRLDHAGVEALEKYVKEGGGLFFVAGPNTSGDFVTRSLYRDGEGLFPLPLTGPQSLPLSPLDNTPDVQSEDHPLFHGIPDRVGFISAIHVDQYYGVAPAWIAKEHANVRVIMKLRNGAPLLVEKNFGRGKVLTLLTTTAAKWNNWALEGAGPSFVAFVKNLVPYMSRRAAADAALQVGDPKTITFAAAQYQPEVRFDGPGGDASAATIEAKPVETEKDKGKEKKDVAMTATFARTALSGFYTAKLTTRTNKVENRVFAVNVDPAEGDLKALAEPDIIARLAPELKPKFDHASTFETQLDESQTRNLGDLLLLVLVIILVLEQLLAWSCGYHASAPAAASVGMPAFGSAKGGRA
jgi:hypothetical protein